MSTFEIFRLVAAAILLTGFIVWRLGIKDVIMERKKKQENEEKATKRREEKAKARQKALEKREQKKRQTSQILAMHVSDLEQKSVTAAKQEFFYLEGGLVNRGSTVLLLHGFASDKEDWNDFAGHLVRGGYHVVAPDLPGFGQNERHPDRKYDVSTQAKRIRAFVKALDLTPIHLVGSCLGGSIAAVYAYGAAVDVLSLTLMEPLGVKAPQEAKLDQWLAQYRNPLLVATPAAYENLLAFLYVDPPEVPEVLKNHRAEQISSHRDFYMKMWGQLRGGKQADIVDMILPEIKKKTLVVQGSESQVLHPSGSEMMVRRMPDATGAMVEGCGHYPAVERPEETARPVLEFLGQDFGETESETGRTAGEPAAG